jgi:phage baseplate assembly protein W
MMATYKGISFPFRFNSKGGVATSELTPDDFSRIRESLEQIIFTRKNERIMLRDKGTKAADTLFENADDITELGILRHDVMKSIEEQEDRVLVNDVTVEPIDVDGEPKILVEIDAHIVKFMVDERFQIII